MVKIKSIAPVLVAVVLFGSGLSTLVWANTPKAECKASSYPLYCNAGVSEEGGCEQIENDECSGTSSGTVCVSGSNIGISFCVSDPNASGCDGSPNYQCGSKYVVRCQWNGQSCEVNNDLGGTNDGEVCTVRTCTGG